MHFDASVCLKTHLVVASFSFPQRFLIPVMQIHHSALGLDAPEWEHNDPPQTAPTGAGH